jgi:hypothetical protein
MGIAVQVGVECGEHDSDSYVTGIGHGECDRGICMARNLSSSVVGRILSEKWKVK